MISIHSKEGNKMTVAERKAKVKELSEAQDVVMRVQDYQRRTSASYRRTQKALDTLNDAHFLLRWEPEKLGSPEAEEKMAKAREVLDLIEAKGADAVMFYNG